MELHLPVVIGLMVAALVLAIGAKRAHVPYNVALVVGGMLISLSHVLPEAPHLEPEVVFLVCLPALLFEGGFTAHLDSIRANLVPIALLATVGMLVAIGATGRPSTVTLPASGVTRPKSALASEVRPEPSKPETPSTSPP